MPELESTESALREAISHVMAHEREARNGDRARLQRLNREMDEEIIQSLSRGGPGR